MENTTQKTNIRWLYLAVGTFAMLFAGILYAWSILKAPFSVEFGWSPSDLTLNFTITMSFFCMGGLLGAQISKRMGSRFAIVISGLLASGGFACTWPMDFWQVWALGFHTMWWWLRSAPGSRIKRDSAPAA